MRVTQSIAELLGDTLVRTARNGPRLGSVVVDAVGMAQHPGIAEGDEAPGDGQVLRGKRPKCVKRSGKSARRWEDFVVSRPEEVSLVDPLTGKPQIRNSRSWTCMVIEGGALPDGEKQEEQLHIETETFMNFAKLMAAKLPAASMSPTNFRHTVAGKSPSIPVGLPPASRKRKVTASTDSLSSSAKIKSGLVKGKMGMSAPMELNRMAGSSSRGKAPMPRGTSPKITSSRIEISTRGNSVARRTPVTKVRDGERPSRPSPKRTLPAGKPGRTPPGAVVPDKVGRIPETVRLTAPLLDGKEKEEQVRGRVTTDSSQESNAERKRRKGKSKKGKSSKKGKLGAEKGESSGREDRKRKVKRKGKSPRRHRGEDLSEQDMDASKSEAEKERKDENKGRKKEKERGVRNILKRISQSHSPPDKAELMLENDQECEWVIQTARSPAPSAVDRRRDSDGMNGPTRKRRLSLNYASSRSGTKHKGVASSGIIASGSHPTSLSSKPSGERILSPGLSSSAMEEACELERLPVSASCSSEMAPSPPVVPAKGLPKSYHGRVSKSPRLNMPGFRSGKGKAQNADKRLSTGESSSPSESAPQRAPGPPPGKQGSLPGLGITASGSILDTPPSSSGGPSDRELDKLIPRSLFAGKGSVRGLRNKKRSATVSGSMDGLSRNLTDGDVLRSERALPHLELLSLTERPLENSSIRASSEQSPRPLPSSIIRTKSTQKSPQMDDLEEFEPPSSAIGTLFGGGSTTRAGLGHQSTHKRTPLGGYGGFRKREEREGREMTAEETEEEMARKLREESEKLSAFLTSFNFSQQPKPQPMRL